MVGSARRIRQQQAAKLLLCGHSLLRLLPHRWVPHVKGYLGRLDKLDCSALPLGLVDLNAIFIYIAPV